jgi:hypothetical protein
MTDHTAADIPQLRAAIADDRAATAKASAEALAAEILELDGRALPVAKTVDEVITHGQQRQIGLRQITKLIGKRAVLLADIAHLENDIVEIEVAITAVTGIKETNA